MSDLPAEDRPLPTSGEPAAPGSLAGRLRRPLMGALWVGMMIMAVLTVVSTYAALQREMQRTLPAALQVAEQRLTRTLMASPLTGDAREEIFASVVSEPSEPMVTSRMRWQTNADGVAEPRWVGPAIGGWAEVGTFRAGWPRDLVDASLLPTGAVLRWVPSRSIEGAPEAPAGGWPDLPTIYRNPDRVLVFGASRGVPRLRTRLVLEVPAGPALLPVRNLAGFTAVLALALTGLMTLLTRRLAEAWVQPIHVLADAAQRVSGGDLDTPVTPVPRDAEWALLTNTFNEMMNDLRKQREQLERANETLTQQNQDLHQANEVLGQLSITDGLTKLHNHRFFQDFLTRELKRVNRSGGDLSILIIDIDDFKRLNDQLGHAAGDELLVRLAEILNDAVRESDLVARYGGEEFVVLALNTDDQGAYQLAEKIRSEIADASFILDNTMRLVKMTVSIGVNAYRGSRKAFFQGADDALYRAKAEGKNCVHVHEEPEPDPEPAAG